MLEQAGNKALEHAKKISKDPQFRDITILHILEKISMPPVLEIKTKP